MTRQFLAALAAFALAACATVPPAVPENTLDALARDYIVLQLTIGEKEAGYIDAYYGPEEFSTRAKAEAPAIDVPGLITRVEAMQARLAATSAMAGSSEARRIAFLSAQLTAAHTRLRMMGGETFSFADEAELLFGVRPELRPLAEFDPVLARLDTIVPGEGTLNERIERLNRELEIPADRLARVLDAGIAECRRRTLQHIAMPEGERFDLAIVTGKPWGAYNYYQGDYHSKIEVNATLPVPVTAAVNYGCHEGYPGHHVYSTLIERDLVREQGRIEYSLLPLYSPQAFIAEGTANHGIKMAFPGNEEEVFTRDVLAPLAGISPEAVTRSFALRQELRALSGANFTIAAQYLSGQIDRAEAVRLFARYGPTSEASADQYVSFVDTYRSYIINYTLGRELAAADVDSAGDQAARWRRFEELLSMGALPGDLRPR